jgi:hypothetical protein
LPFDPCVEILHVVNDATAYLERLHRALWVADVFFENGDAYAEICGGGFLGEKTRIHCIAPSASVTMQPSAKQTPHIRPTLKRSMKIMTQA